MDTNKIIQALKCLSSEPTAKMTLTQHEVRAMRATISKLQYFDSLLQVAKHAYLDLKGIMPEFEPSGDREHSGWDTLEELRTVVGLYDPSFIRGKDTNIPEPTANILPTVKDKAQDKVTVTDHALEVAAADLEIACMLLTKEKEKSAAFVAALEAIRELIWPPGPATGVECAVDRVAQVVLHQQLG